MRLNKKLMAVILIPVLAVAAVLIVLSISDTLKGHTLLRIGYAGTKTVEKWSGSYLKLDGTMTGGLKSDSDELYVEITTESGKIGVQITDPDGKPLYTGNELDTCSFSVITEGKADITITADDHKGSFLFSFTKPER